MALDRDGVIKQVEKLSEAPYVYEGLKEKAQAFLRAVDTPGEKPAYAALIDEIKSDVLTIDQLIGFTDSPEGIAAFGEKKASGLTIAAKKAKSQGETTCICPACQAGKVILENRAAIAS